MGRRSRNRDFDFAEDTAKVIALLVCLAMFVPQVRQTLLGIGLIALALLVIVDSNEPKAALETTKPRQRHCVIPNT
jgi:hypothetical protein